MTSQFNDPVIVVTARRHLDWLFGIGPAVNDNDLLLPPLPRVNVTLRTSGALRGSMSGTGASFRDQLLDAVDRAANDRRFSGSLVRADLEHVSVEVWLQLSAEVIPVEDRLSEKVIEFGRDGVEVSFGKAFAYYKPSVALTSHFKTEADMFRALCKKAKLPPNSWREAECDLRKTSWVHLCETSVHQVVRLDALRSVDTEIVARDQLVDWIRDGANYFIHNQHSTGAFCYQYKPLSDVEKKAAANPVRASGCMYAVAAAYSSPHFGLDLQLRDCVERGLVDILRRTVRLKDGGGYIADSSSGSVGGKLGTTALMLLALLTSELVGSHSAEIEILTAAIKSAQQADGLFNCSFGECRTSDSQTNFFPGQALLALVRKAELGDETCRELYGKALVPYREHFRRAPSTAFVGWHAEVWSKAALLDNELEYADFVFEQIDWLLQFQLHSPSDRLTTGGFGRDGKPPNYSSIVYTEAIARGAYLAHKLGDGRWLRYRDAFLAGLAFCRRLRLTRDQAVFFPNPQRAIGGMTTSLTNFDVRSDVVQHAITLGLAGLDYPILLQA